MSKLKVTLKDLFNIPYAEILNPDGFKPSNYVSIDSRTLRKNSIYFALKGEKFDGHKFVNDAVANGASTIIISKRQLKNAHVGLAHSWRGLPTTSSIVTILENE